MIEDAVDRVDTTIGELIAAITEISLEAGSSEEESYQLASITLQDILTRKAQAFSALMS